MESSEEQLTAELPPIEELKARLRKLSQRGIVAFAARSARRTQPYFDFADKSGVFPDFERHRKAVDRAISVAERFAGGGDARGAADAASAAESAASTASELAASAKNVAAAKINTANSRIDAADSNLGRNVRFLEIIGWGVVIVVGGGLMLVFHIFFIPIAIVLFLMYGFSKAQEQAQSSANAYINSQNKFITAVTEGNDISFVMAKISSMAANIAANVARSAAANTLDESATDAAYAAESGVRLVSSLIDWHASTNLTMKERKQFKFSYGGNVGSSASRDLARLEELSAHATSEEGDLVGDPIDATASGPLGSLGSAALQE